MGRINSGSGQQAIGEERLKQFVIELNEQRARAGIRTRYRTVRRNGLLCMDGPY